MTEDCTLYKTINMFSRRWTLLILLELSKGRKGNKRYSELKRGLAGITPKILAARLRELEGEGLIKRDVDTSSVPIRCEYCLTESGRDIFGVLHKLKSWGLKWKFESRACSNRDCKSCILPDQ